VYALIGEIFRLRRMLATRCLLTGMGTGAIDPTFFAVQQILHKALVVDIGRRDRLAVYQTVTAVDSDMRFLSSSAHRCSAINDRSDGDLQTPVLQRPVDLCELLRAWRVPLQQATELEQPRSIRNPLPTQIDTDESAHSHADQKGFLARLVGQLEPVLHKVHSQHRLQSHRRTTSAWLRLVWLDHGT
jgi:hypothetical protein